ncbi:MAG: DNA/RNA non-specific endonuclease [Bacillota bacterium]
MKIRSGAVGQLSYRGMARRRKTSYGPGQFDFRPLIEAFQRLSPQARIAVLAVLLIIGIIAALVYQRGQPQQPVREPQVLTAPITSTGEANMLLGNPSGATAEVSNRDNYLMVKQYYALSYNNAAGIANWVSWRVAAADLGNAPRKRLFDPDGELPLGFKRVVSQDYSGSGFDRGHLCPHSDRAADEAMSFSTFVMTNIVPQAPNVNEKAWAHMEAYCRALVRQQHQRLYIVAGPAGRGGRGSAGLRETIGRSKVTVPAQCWKVVVSVSESGGADDLAKINPSTRVITVLMPNDNEVVGDEWAKYRTSPAEVEQRTGLHFFDRLPPGVAETLRQKVDRVSITPAQISSGEE